MASEGRMEEHSKYERWQQDEEGSTNESEHSIVRKPEYYQPGYGALQNETQQAVQAEVLKRAWKNR